MALIKFPTKAVRDLDETCFILPDPRITPYTMQTQSSVVGTTFESGRFRARNRFTQERQLYSLSFFFTDLEFAFFRGFWTNLINEGADDLIFNLKLDIDFCDYQVKFIGPYSAAHTDDGWAVTAQVLVEDPDVLSEDIICAMMAIGNNFDAFIDATDDLHELLHETIPISTPF